MRKSISKQSFPDLPVNGVDAGSLDPEKYLSHSGLRLLDLDKLHAIALANSS
ncbi:MAG: hypothetical protein QY326_02120 [Bdellovibrionota bacterium]|nr:MAG: hypothetical protein QY326_02120 [Bdellovibrionota bacterium]